MALCAWKINNTAPLIEASLCFLQRWEKEEQEFTLDSKLLKQCFIFTSCSRRDQGQTLHPEVVVPGKTASLMSPSPITCPWPLCADKTKQQRDLADPDRQLLTTKHANKPAGAAGSIWVENSSDTSICLERSGGRAEGGVRRPRLGGWRGDRWKLTSDGHQISSTRKERKKMASQCEGHTGGHARHVRGLGIESPIRTRRNILHQLNVKTTFHQK